VKIEKKVACEAECTAIELVGINRIIRGSGVSDFKSFGSLSLLSWEA
jgi:hypothetical protein